LEDTVNEFDQQNSSSEGAEPLQIANLDCEEPRRRRRVEHVLTLLSQSVATPRRRYTLTGFLLLFLLSMVFFKSRKLILTRECKIGRKKYEGSTAWPTHNTSKC
jgi:hypothetical protein